MRFPVLGFAVLIASASQAADFTVVATQIADQKAVLATVESLNVVPARARVGGTVGQLGVKAGDQVRAGQVIAVVADAKLLLQIAAIDAQIVGLQASLAQAQADLVRAETLARQGSGTRVAMDQARTASDVANATLRARIAERSVIRQQAAEGDVLAPADGKVLQVPVTDGSVALPGDSIAIVAQQSYVLRLSVPESQAGYIRQGDPVRLDTTGRGDGRPAFGTITLVYPRIENGRVIADATMPDLSKYFVGERVPVWIGVAPRTSFVVPDAAIVTRFGLDYVRRRAGAAVLETPVQRGRAMPTAAMPNAVEILSGLASGDVLVLQ